MKPRLHQWLRTGLLRRLGPLMPGLLTCAVGRSLDFATTWIGLTRGLATEAQPGAAHLTACFGPQLGLLFYEGLVTTPAIFLGCWLLRWVNVASLRARTRQVGLFYFIGLVSLATGLHNLRLIF